MIQIGLYAISNLVLGGYTGAIINVLCCFRDFLCYKDKLGIKEKVIIIIASTTLSIIFNNMGWIGYLPVISTAIYIMFMSVKDVIKFKYLTIFSMVAWAIYNFYIKLYTGMAFNIFTIITCIIAIVQIYKKRKLNN